MAAYLYATGKVLDPETYERYRQQVPALIARHGGRYLVRGGAAERLEGEGAPDRQVILEFPDMAHLKAFYHSPEYQPLIALRQQSTTITVLAVEGVYNVQGV